MKIWCCLAILGSLALMTGCVAVAAAGVAAGVVHMTSEDTAEVHLEGPIDEIFDLCSNELQRLGSVHASERPAFMTGSIDGAKVEVELRQVTRSAVRVAVQARRNGGISPDRDAAEKLAHAVLAKHGR